MRKLFLLRHKMNNTVSSLFNIIGVFVYKVTSNVD